MRCLFLVKNQYFYHSVVPGLGPEAWIGLYKQLFPGQEHPKPIIDFDKGLGDEEGSTSHPVTSHVVDVNSAAIPVASLPVAQESGPSSDEKPRPSLAEEKLFQPKRRYYSASVEMFLAILAWDVIGTPRMSKSTTIGFDRYAKRKQHHVDPFALEFLQDFFNKISENLGDHLELRMPCPFRCFA